MSYQNDVKCYYPCQVAFSNTLIAGSQIVKFTLVYFVQYAREHYNGNIK